MFVKKHNLSLVRLIFFLHFFNDFMRIRFGINILIFNFASSRVNANDDDPWTSQNHPSSTKAALIDSAVEFPTTFASS